LPKVIPYWYFFNTNIMYLSYILFTCMTLIPKYLHTYLPITMYCFRSYPTNMFFNTNTHSIIYPSLTLFMGTTLVFTYLHTYLLKDLSYVPTYSHDNIWIPQILPWFPCKALKLRFLVSENKLLWLQGWEKGKEGMG
jgi:hypothetical protein